MDYPKYIQRCFQLAENGLGKTYPNPLVGCVIVADGKIIGEGWHRKAGEIHAEVMAIRQVTDHNLLKKATLFVSLEPCAHYGRTPPCASLIIEKEIPQVVVGCRDPFDAVAGKGIAMLKKAGIHVIEGDWNREAQHINRRFITFHLKKRPYIILKWAETRDGFVAPTTQKWGASTAISGNSAQRYNHKWRTEEMAILVGFNTAIKDNPTLTPRHFFGNRPLRIVVDPKGALPHHYQLLSDGQPTLWVTKNQQPYLNASVENLPFEVDNQWLPKLMEHLYQKQIQSIIVEGGPATQKQFIESSLVDEFRIFSSLHRTLYEGVRSLQPKLFSTTKSLLLEEDLLIQSISS